MNARQVYTDLMRPPRARADFAQTIAPEAFNHLVETTRFLAFLPLVRHDHLNAVIGMVANASFNVIAVPIGYARRDRHILLENLPFLELHAQVAMCLFLFGNEDDPACITVEAMDDPGPIIA